MKRLGWLVCLAISLFFGFIGFGSLSGVAICILDLLGIWDAAFGESKLEVFLLAVICAVLTLVCGFVGIGAYAFVEKLEDMIEKEKSAKENRERTRTYTGGYGYGGYSYNRTLHDELDAASHAIGLRETYGPDWAGYDPEAAGPNPDVYYFPPGYDPEAYSGDIY